MSQPRKVEIIDSLINHLLNMDIQSRTDEEIVNSTNYNFNLSIETLLNDSTTTRRARCLQRVSTSPNPPRPQNSYILYSKNKVAVKYGYEYSYRSKVSEAKDTEK
jgi:hypothetical protein